jgi:hypothetical protein
MSYLIYVNELGPNYKGESIYEFIFSDTVKDVWGESWESKPSNGYPSPPDIDFIKKVGVLKSGTIKMSVIQNSDFFCMTDAIDDVIALSWEEETEYSNFEFDKRLVFRFGDTEENVKNKLYERDKVLEFEKKLSYEEQ